MPRLGDVFNSDFKNMASKSADEMLYLREKYAKDPQMQKLLAPFDHRAWAREQVQNDLSLLPFYLLATPGYQAAKALGFDSATATPPSLDQLFAGWQGALEGAFSAPPPEQYDRGPGMTGVRG